MILKSIRIENFEGIVGFESSFRRDITYLTGKNVPDVVKAIGVILQNGYMTGRLEGNGRGAPALIEAEMELGGRTYTAAAERKREEGPFGYAVRTDAGPPGTTDFYAMIRRTPEEKRLELFSEREARDYPARLRSYRDYREFYSEKAFSELTEGIGKTRTFRACLSRYIGEYSPPEGSGDFRVRLREDGGFTAEKERKGALSRAEKKMFEFACFLSINEFWSRLEGIRDINHPVMPVVVAGIGGERERSMLKAYLEKTEKNARQTIVAAC